MDIFLNFPEWHKTKLAEFIKQSTPDSMELCEAAVELGVLPLMLDMGGCFAIRANGEVVSFPWDDIQDVRVEDDQRIRNITLFQGSKKYPELKDLIPLRPDDAIECSSCDGTGVERTTAKLGLDNIVCYCGGLGWIPQKDQAMNP